MKKITFFVLLIISFGLQAQTTSIPDAAFEQYLIDQEIDTDGTLNAEVATANIQAITSLDLTGTGVNDLTGLQDFSNLEILNISELFLTEVDLSGNTMLKELYATFNQFTELDLSSNTQLELLDAMHNELTEIDFSNNTLLQGIAIGNEMDDVMPHNMIEELDLSNNPNISHLYLRNMDILSINLANGSNNDNMYINTGWDTFPPHLVCVNVDDNQAAENGDSPYNSWNLTGDYDFGTNCAMGTDNFSFEKLSFYPNPFNDILFFETEKTWHYQLYNILGAQIGAGQIPSGSNSLNLQEIANGIYFLKLKNAEGATKTIKVLKE